MTDVIIIGAGVTGSAAARELSRLSLSILVLEKGDDIASGSSKANSGIVHAGFDAKPGSLKGRLNAPSNAMFDRLAEELDFPFRRNGALVLCFDPADIPKLEALKRQGEENGVPGLRIIDRAELGAMEPNISDGAAAALYAPTSGIVSPYEMTIALAENAAQNGVDFRFGEQVVSVTKTGGGFEVVTGKGTYHSRLVINAAGLYADEINNMVSAKKLSIRPRRGEYSLFDRTVGGFVNRTVFQLPTELGKGVLVTPTADGNLLIGPNADDIDDKSDLSTTAAGQEEIFAMAELSVKSIPRRQVIKSFSGLRAHEAAGDFVIGEAEDCEGFINAAGIESPGLSSAPAVGVMLAGIVKDKLGAAEKADFNPKRPPVVRFRELDNESRDKLIKSNPAYGRIVCRCETVTEGEIIDAMRRPLGARSLDGIKRRTRAGMGRCQAGFCSPRTVELIAKELGIELTGVNRGGEGSNLLVGEDKHINQTDK